MLREYEASDSDDKDDCDVDGEPAVGQREQQQQQQENQQQEHQQQVHGSMLQREYEAFDSDDDIEQSRVDDDERSQADDEDDSEAVVISLQTHFKVSETSLAEPRLLLSDCVRFSTSALMVGHDPAGNISTS